MGALPTVSAGHTPSDTWDVDQTAYVDDTDCIPSIRHCNRIDAAIASASAGDTIVVAPGTYTQALVIDKQLTVLGAQADVDPRPSQGGRTGPESIIETNDTAVTIEADVVRFNGFTIKSHIDDGGVPMIFVNNSSIPRVAYNIVYNADPDGVSGDGIRVFDTRFTGFTVDHNHVHTIRSLGAAISARFTDAANISSNEVHDVNTSHGIFVSDSTGPVVRDNLVYDTLGNGITLTEGQGGPKGPVLLNEVEQPPTSFIVDNTLNNTTANGIFLQHGNVHVLRNLVRGAGEGSSGLNLSLGTFMIRAEDNCFLDNDGGVYVGRPADGESVAVHGNNIVGNDRFGLLNHALTTVNATQNWWGHASGPSGVGPGSGDAVSARVVFEPWRTELAPDTPCSPPSGCAGPEHVDAAAEGDGDIFVEWSAVADADGYNIYRAVGGGGFALHDSVDGSTTDYEDTTTDVGKTYHYRVTAVIDENETEHCDQASATAVPVFPTVVAGGLAVLVGIGAYVAFRRRR